jgi:ATP-dependent DNA helicase RecQ
LAGLVPDWNWSKVAVIAREWELLAPVRSYCEAIGIPVQSANEEVPSFWRFRETQAFVSWLQSQPGARIAPDLVEAWLRERSDDGWWPLLRDAQAEFAAEFGNGEVFTKDLIEWLAEWSRDLRRKQSGLLLLTAYRAKGLEFDHVVVLDWSWGWQSEGEDRDAARRLFYVAMTRAKLSLTLMCRDNTNHPILSRIMDRSFLVRCASEPSPDTSACRRHYQTLNLSQIDLSYAGRLSEDHPALKAIQQLRVEDELSLEKHLGRWLLRDRHGNVVARLARSYNPPPHAKFVRGRVLAITVRRRHDAEADYHHLLRRDIWEVVVPELVFEH